MENDKCKCGNHIFNDDIFCLPCTTRFSSVIVNVGDIAMYIYPNEYKEYEKYKDLKKKWDWMD
jgi:hypothetical protein